MKDSVIQKKLNQLVKIANELSDEAKRRYQDPHAMLFFESGGVFHIMSGDSDEMTDESIASRQEYIRFSSDGYCKMGAGAW